MISPKEKAKLLVDEVARIDGYTDSINLSKCDYEKKIALLIVDQIIEFMKDDDDYTDTCSNANSIWIHYYAQVKTEIKNL